MIDVYDTAHQKFCC